MSWGWELRAHSFTLLLVLSLLRVCVCDLTASSAASCHAFFAIIDSLSETKGQITFPSKVVFYLSSRKVLIHVLGLVMSDFAWCFFKAQCKFLALRSPPPPPLLLCVLPNRMFV